MTSISFADEQAARQLLLDKPVSHPIPFWQISDSADSDRLRTAANSTIDFGSQPRVSHSRQPQKWVRLFSGDQFLVTICECIDQSLICRLADRQLIEIPLECIATIGTPIGETELDIVNRPDSEAARLAVHQSTKSAGAAQLITTPERNTYWLAPPLEAARFEFSFNARAVGESEDSWELNLFWHLVSSPITVRRISHQSIEVVNLSDTNSTSQQRLTPNPGWHDFLAIVTADRTTLMVDNSLLASFSTPPAKLERFEFPKRGNEDSTTIIENLRVRSLNFADTNATPNETPIESDIIQLTNGDSWFGNVEGLIDSGPVMGIADRRRSVPWNQIRQIALRPGRQPLAQQQKLVNGFQATIQHQPFIDRPNSPAETWYVTVSHANSEQLWTRHSLLGSIPFQWKNIRRITWDQFGQSHLIDARSFHLGNSIRSDFSRQLPDGTEYSTQFELSEIPPGQPFISMYVSEMEAAGNDAPPGSPFLTELRAGQLVTELLINDQSVGNVNAHFRFKSASSQPERVRVPIHRDMLQKGTNSLRLVQRPLKDQSREFDDCEVGHFRLELKLPE